MSVALGQVPSPDIKPKAKNDSRMRRLKGICDPKSPSPLTGSDGHPSNPEHLSSPRGKISSELTMEAFGNGS